MHWKELVIDANLNRAREGCRVLEEIARFVLRNGDMLFLVRGLRHQLTTHEPLRDIDSDPGMVAETSLSDSRTLFELINANSARVQEALRVLEECSDDRSRFKTLRFEAYRIHQRLFNEVRRFYSHENLHGLYVIFDPNAYDVTIDHVVNVVVSKKARLVQLRHKLASKQQIISLTQQLRLALPQGVLLLVNDHVDVGLAFADGVHLGQEDFPIADAKRIAPSHFVIGASANSVDEALAAQKAGASYVSMGCVFGSTTKTNTRPIQVAEIVRAKALLHIPVCAIGGINAKNREHFPPTSLDMIAMCAGVFG